MKAQGFTLEVQKFKDPVSKIKTQGSRFKVKVQGSSFKDEGSRIQVQSQKFKDLGSMAKRSQVKGSRTKAQGSRFSPWIPEYQKKRQFH